MQGEHPIGRLRARCGAALDLTVIQHDQPPHGPPCETCRLIFIADHAARDSSTAQGGPR